MRAVSLPKSCALSATKITRRPDDCYNGSKTPFFPQPTIPISIVPAESLEPAKSSPIPTTSSSTVSRNAQWRLWACFSPARNTPFLDHRQQTQGGAARLLDATLPVGNEIAGDVQIAGKYRLRDMLAQPQCLDFFRAEYMYRRQARLVELPHRLFVDGAYLMQRLRRFVNRGEGVIAVSISMHRLSH